MPDAPKPVTLSQLCVSEHLIIGEAVGWVVTESGETEGYGFRPATVADLVSALRAEGVLVVESSVRHNWPAWAIDVLRYDVAALAERGAVAILDALAEAQPFPPAGGVS